jgi:hypothetical protein
MTILSAYRLREYIAVRIRVDTPVPPSTDIHLAILLDISDSMDGDRLDAVKRTLHAARDLLRPTDRITLVCFGNEAEVVVSNHVLGDAASFYRRVDALRTRGCTNLSAGIEALLSLHLTYSGVLLLTDGMINRGITSTAGLCDMMRSVGDLPITALGYGADHNRELLRRLATRSRGSYTYVDSDELLADTMGDLISGLREIVYRRAVMHAEAHLCMESDADGGTYRMGDIVVGRDYWTIYRASSEAPTVPVQLLVNEQIVAEAIPASAEGPEIEEQIFRWRTATLMARALDSQNNTIRDAIVALQAEMAPLGDRPLIARLRAQLAEMLTEIVDRPTWSATPHAMARMHAATSQMATQRGVDPDALFSSPTQRVASQQCRTAYTHGPQDPQSPS